ncbi:MAG TPA: hypothetical protein VNA23_01935 [Anaerolineales bacterium]|nr:hypothetical protein [Anaerolineales bacterium]
MKPRTQFLVAIGLIILILGIAWYTFSTRNQAAIEVFPATINRDCAPWDGSAFTVSIPMDNEMINISIWQSPDIPVPVTFSFPDETGQIGFAYMHPDDQLSGKVFFLRVDETGPVEGEFDLKDQSGRQFKGKFKAEWGNEVMYCG